MSAQIADPEATVWLEEVPARVFWEAKRWRVIDMPQRVGVLPDAAYWLTHPPTAMLGWRFRARAEEDGTERTFEVVAHRVSGWDVVRVTP